jgi:putative glutamine amidotransferase
MGGGAVPVNSMHHQGIRDLSSRLVATATAPDGLIEAAEATDDNFALGVQWHPEMYSTGEPSTGQLFDAFVAAARGESRLA